MKKGTSSVVRKKSRLIPRLVITFSVVLVLTLSLVFLFRFVHKKTHSETSISYLYEKWNEYDYQSVYDISNSILAVKPFNNSALTLHGYASFFLATRETDTMKSQAYLDESINSMRLALQNARHSTVPQLEYMLGRAYFYKDEISSYHYYADLAVQYLLRARRDGYKSDDIPELLGLSYASLGMTMDSIASFTEALLVRETDFLLLSIGEQYFKAGQASASEQYLYRISTNCKDERIVLKSHVLLGQIYLSQEKYAEAEKEFQTILEKNQNSADAYYGLGVIYEKGGDLIKARSEWRKALRIQANHPDALKKMAEYK